MRNTWTAFLADILPASWSWEDRDAFYFDDADGTIEWSNTSSSATGDVLAETYEHDALKLELTVTKYPNECAAMVKAFLVNGGRTACRLNRIQLIDLRFGSQKGPIHFRALGGGENVKHYPPEIFNVDDYLCDGSSGIWREHGYDGRSSEKTLPLMGISLNGAAVIAGLEWSGLWWSTARGNDSGDGQAAAHMLFHIPVKAMEIEPGEQFECPAAHLVFSDEGFDGAGNNCRHHIANNVLPSLDGKRMEHPAVVYNHWFGLGPDINETILKKQAEISAEIGAEYFVLDAGWYGGCEGDDFQNGVGNWEVVDTDKFPNGIEPLANHVRSLGLKFGMWFEPERAHVKSDWYRRHPEWFLQRGDETENSHVHIDLSQPCVQESVFRVISEAITGLGCEWIKWDYNINPKRYWENSDATGRLMFDYMKGLFTVQQRLLDAHPQVVFECCASGGRRVDLGQMRRSHICLQSDSVSSSLVCRFMQTGANRLLPASYLGVGVAFGDIDTNRNSNEGPLRDLQPLSRMSGAPIIYGDIASLSDSERGVLTSNIATFKTWRHLHNQDFFPLLPHPRHQDDYAAVEFISFDRKEAVVLIYSGPARKRYPCMIPPKALSPRRTYSAEIIGGTPCAIQGGTGEELTKNGWVIDLEPREAVAFRLAAVQGS